MRPFPCVHYHWQNPPWDLMYVRWHQNPLPRDGMMQTKSRVRSTLIFWPVTFQISGSKKKAQSEQTNCSFGHTKRKLCTPCKHMHALPIYKSIIKNFKSTRTGASTQNTQMKSAPMPQSFLRNHRIIWRDSELTISPSPRGLLSIGQIQSIFGFLWYPTKIAW